MSKRIFSQEQIESLLQNPNVAKCSEKSISYHKGFKVMAVKKYQEGFPASLIFKQAGFNIDMIGREIPEDSLLRWRRIFKDKGEEGLKTDGRKGNSPGRPKTSWSNEKEKIKYLEAENAYLKEENRFLVKLRKKSLN
jgi:hypothetical protein